jgi:hypothetical protein
MQGKVVGLLVGLLLMGAIGFADAQSSDSCSDPAYAKVSLGCLCKAEPQGSLLHQCLCPGHPKSSQEAACKAYHAQNGGKTRPSGSVR